MSAEWAALLNDALRHGAGLPDHLLLPWERGFAGQVLGRGAGLGRALSGGLYDLPPIAPPPVLPPSPLPRRAPEDPPVPRKRKLDAARFSGRTTFGRAKAPRGRSQEELEGAARDKTLTAWTALTWEAAESTLKRQCHEDLDEYKKSLELLLASRSTATLTKRANSILTYLRWHRCVQEAGEPLPPKEETLFRYFQELHQEGAAPTRAKACLEALNLAAALVGFDDAAMQSQRVMAAADAAMRRKPPTLQRPPLPVRVVKLLEDGVFNAVSDCDKIFAGFLCFTVHGRLRFLDAARIDEEPTLEGDGSSGFVEARCRVHKGSNRPRARGLTLPAVGMSVGLTGEAWAEEWLRLRSAMGLDAGVDGALMLKPLASGGFSRKRITTTEGVMWMRELLMDGGITAHEASTYGTHSCKATLLSWAAKSGMPKPDRRLLGGHAAPKDRSVLEYSRDALGEPLRKLSILLDKVALGDFLPDASRSGRWPGFRAERAGAGDGSTDESTVSASSDSSARTVDEAEEERELDGHLDSVAAGLEDPSSETASEEEVDESAELPEGGLYQHVRYHLLHAASVVPGSGKLVCGRQITDKYRLLESWPVASWARCKG